jgi:Cys-tRNA(Pro)/Cys-tRNA(Cys) deacylase
MDYYEDKLREYMTDKSIEAEHLSFSQSCHSVNDAAKAAGAPVDDFVKNICLIDVKGNPIVAIVMGEDRVSMTKVGNVLGLDKPRTMTPEEILEKTGYPCGGTPSFGYEAIFLIDEKVMAKGFVYTGGGSQNSLVKISPKEMQKANRAKVEKISR